MFRSLGSSLISLFIVIVAGFMILFIWSGTGATTFARVAMDGDKSLATLLHEEQKRIAAEEVPYDDDRWDGDPDMTGSSGSAGGDAVVLWLSVPGFRGDYLDESETPTFDEINGASTGRLVPLFPCLTFPAHATLATGRDVAAHGIPSDRFRLADGTIVDHPTDGKMLSAEAIWTTATRQGVRTLVHDWPLSQNQSGEHASAHFLTSYNTELTDQQRLDALYEAWSGDSDPTTLRLLMARLNDLNLVGMRNGPTDDGTHEAVTALDKLVGEFIAKLTADWSKLAKPDAKLVVILTTDHGLAPMEKNINLVELLKPTPAFKFLEKFEILSSRSMANIYFKELPPEGPLRDDYIDEVDRELESKLYWRTFSPEKLPSNWNYTSPDGRIGDRVIVLKRGYGFTDATGSEPVFDPAEGEGFFASYGYPVEDSSRMKGQMMIWSPNGDAPVYNLDEPTTTQLHPTVCKLLGIEPAAGVTAKSLTD